MTDSAGGLIVLCCTLLVCCGLRNSACKNRKECSLWRNFVAVYKERPLVILFFYNLPVFCKNDTNQKFCKSKSSQKFHSYSYATFLDVQNIYDVGLLYCYDIFFSTCFLTCSKEADQKGIHLSVVKSALQMYLYFLLVIFFSPLYSRIILMLICPDDTLLCYFVTLSCNAKWFCRLCLTI